MTIERANEICSVVCDTICRYPFEGRSEDELDEKCNVCPLAKELAKEINEGANAVQVVHSEWQRCTDRIKGDSVRCARCGLELSAWYNRDLYGVYCPHCGAKMDGEGE